MSVPTATDDPEDQLRQATRALEVAVARPGAGGAEEFLAAYPDLASDPDLAAELILAEFVARERAGQRPDPDDFLRRFPDRRDRLAEQFELHRFLAEARPLGLFAADPGAARRIGGYELIREIARGGAGVVYLARDLELGREVAVKMILAGPHATPRGARRLRAEAEAAARLHHPNIVVVHDVGEADGLPFVAFEYLAGGTLTERLAAGPLAPAVAARLVATLARAIGHAHRLGVVHRDLKPSNILFTDSARPADAVPKVADFGLARSVGAADWGDESSPAVGTPSYAAPEQIGGGGPVGPAADVYALGAVLYECLTGRPPFRDESPLATLRRVLTETPTPPRRLAPQVPRDLETVGLKCLEKDPARRYGSADALADDLEAFLTGRPVAARPVGPVRAGGMWCRRRPGLAAAAAVALLVGVAAAAAGAWHYAELRVHAETETRLRAEADRRAEELRDQLEVARRDQYTIALARAADLTRTNPAEALAVLENQALCPPDLRDFTWGMFVHQCRQGSVVLRGAWTEPRSAVFSPDGEWLAVAADDGVELWTPEDARFVRRTPGAVPGARAVGFAPDGRALAVGGRDGSVWVWNLADQIRLLLPASATEPIGLVFSPDGRELAVTRADFTTDLVDAVTGRSVWGTNAPLREAKAIAFVPHRPVVAVVGVRGVLRMHDRGTGAEVARRTVAGTDYLLNVAVTPDGETLAVTGGAGKNLMVFHGEAMEPRGAFVAHSLPIWCLAVTPNGTVVATSGEDRDIRLWTVGGLELRGRLLGHKGTVRGLSFSADGQRLASTGDDRTVRLWPVPPVAEPSASYAIPVAVRFAPDGRSVISVRPTGSVMTRPISATNGEPVTHLGGLMAADVAPDLGRIAFVGNDGRLRVWAADGRFADPPGADKDMTRVAFSPDGVRLAAGDKAGRLHVWRLPDLTPEATAASDLGAVRSLAFDPHGRTVGSGHASGAIACWEANTLNRLGVTPADRSGVPALALGPDGRIAFSRADGSAGLVAVPGNGPVLRLIGHNLPATSVAVSPDGRTVATGSRDSSVGGVFEVKLWDARSGHLRATLPDQTGPLAFAPGGQSLATVGRHGAVVVWQADPY